MSAEAVPLVYGSGTELGRAEITSNATSSSTTPVDVAGLSITVACDGSPIELLFWCESLVNSQGLADAIAFIQEGATSLTACAVTAPTTAKGANGIAIWQGTPSPGSHTYKVTLKTSVNTTTTATIQANGAFPAFLQARKR